VTAQNGVVSTFALSILKNKSGQIPETMSTRYFLEQCLVSMRQQHELFLIEVAFYHAILQAPSLAEEALTQLAMFLDASPVRVWYVLSFPIAEVLSMEAVRRLYLQCHSHCLQKRFPSQVTALTFRRYVCGQLPIIILIVELLQKVYWADWPIAAAYKPDRIIHLSLSSVIFECC
jgi:hypothetical protein